MCNHYQGHPEAIQTWAEYAGYELDREQFSDIKVDIFPRRPALIVRTSGGRRVIGPVQLGVPLTIPGKRPGTTVTKHVTNVRNLASPFWRSMLAKHDQRCLVPFTRFAEPKPNAGREEVWFALRDVPVGAFAGIWRPSDAGDVFAFLTCEPNPLVAPIHPKAMPVILHPGDYDAWLDGAPAADLAQPFPSQLMEVVGASD